MRHDGRLPVSAFCFSCRHQYFQVPRRARAAPLICPVRSMISITLPRIARHRDERCRLEEMPTLFLAGRYLDRSFYYGARKVPFDAIFLFSRQEFTRWAIYRAIFSMIYRKHDRRSLPSTNEHAACFCQAADQPHAASISTMSAAATAR